MGDCNSTFPALEGEDNLIAAAQNLVKALEANKNLTNGTRKILADLGSQLSGIAVICVKKDAEGIDVGEVEERLNKAQDKIKNWEMNQSMIWDCGPEEVTEYLKNVDEVQKLIEGLENSWTGKGSNEDILLRRAHDLLQIAMARLEEEFVHILNQNRQPFEPEHMSFRSSEDEIIEENSVASFGDDYSFEEVAQRESMGRVSEEFVVDLVHPEVIPDLKCIANLMFNSNYGSECSQAFISVRKDALDDCLFILEVEKLSIEDVLKLEWNSLNSKIRRWIRAMKIFVRVYLASEKWLSCQVFGELESVTAACFSESSKASMLQLLNFGEAIAVGPYLPEKLIRILDMYEVLEDLIPDINTLYSDESGSIVRMECQDVLKRLGDCAKGTFLDFQRAVGSYLSTNPYVGGAIHPLTKYVMNYIKILLDYQETLNVLLKNEEEEDSFLGVEISGSSSSSGCVSPMALRFHSLISTLECSLEDKSKLYKDDPLRHIFLMNNIHYMAEKVKGSEIRTVLGDDWIRKHNWKFQQHAMSYERAAWSSVVHLLRDEGLHNPGSSSISKTLLKERLHNFYIAFEDVYRNQTGWLIPDEQLREDLQISTSVNVIQAYRTFVGRHINHLSDRNIKYSAEDLQNYLLDLFNGSPRSLHNCHKK